MCARAHPRGCGFLFRSSIQGKVLLCGVHSGHDAAILQDAVHPALVGAVVKPLRHLIQRQHRDPLDAAHALRLLVVEQTEKTGGQKDIGVRVSHELVAMSLCHTNAYREQRLTDGFAERDVDALWANSSLFVRFGGPQELSYAPAPVATLNEVVQQGVDISPETFVEHQWMVLRLMAPQQQ